MRNFDFLRGRRYKSWYDLLSIIKTLNRASDSKSKIFEAIYNSNYENLDEFELEVCKYYLLPGCMFLNSKDKWFA